MVEEMNQGMAEIPAIPAIKIGDIVKGKVTKIEEKQALIDIGYKYDGIIPIGEVSNLHIEKVSDVLNVGDEVELKVIKINDEEENLILSKRGIDSEKAWEILEQRFKSQEAFDVKVVEIVKGGLVVDLGVRGFIPASLVEKHFVEDFSDYRGRILAVKIVELVKEKNKVILSHKAVIEEEQEKKKQEIFTNIKQGDIIEGTVQRLTDFGAFVNLGGIDGLAHISEMSWHRVEKPSDILKEGDTVKVKVLRVDAANHRISLSIKATQEGPFKSALEKLKVGEIYSGIVRRLTNFGAFIELLPNVEGLVHISQISSKHISKPSDVLKVGQEVKVKLLNVDEQAERLSLSISEAEEEENYKEVQQRINDIENKGLNLTLGDVLGDKLKKLR